MILTIKQHTKDLLVELSRINWPNKEKVLSAASSVVIISVLVGIFLWVTDWVIAHGMRLILPR